MRGLLLSGVLLKIIHPAALSPAALSPADEAGGFTPLKSAADSRPVIVT